MSRIFPSHSKNSGEYDVIDRIASLDASFTVAQFYAEIEGHPSDAHVAHALEELQFFCTKLKILGTYPQHPFRITNNQG